MSIKIVKKKISKKELLKLANEKFGDLIKAVVDIEQEIMAIGGELHADEEVLLSEKEKSKRENTWGINIYPQKSSIEWIEFDSMINIKPQCNNRSRGIENKAIQNKIKKIVGKLTK